MILSSEDLSCMNYISELFAIKTSKFFRGIFLDCRLGQIGSPSTVCDFQCTLIFKYGACPVIHITPPSYNLIQSEEISSVNNYLFPRV